MSEKEKRVFVKPPKNLEKMTTEEIHEYAEVLWAYLVERMDPEGEYRRATNSADESDSESKED